MRHDAARSDLPVSGEIVEAAQDVVYRWLKRHVLTLPRHDGVFVTEAEVCRAIGTSRTPVREALLRLESEGLLQILPKKGAYVPAITETDVAAVMQARGLVEEWCARQACVSNDGLVEELQRLMGEQEALRERPVEFIECDREFHRTLVLAAGNPFIAAFYETLRDRQLRMGLHAIVNVAERADIALAEHAAIVEAIRLGDPHGAAAAMAAHLAKTLAALQSPPREAWTRRGHDPQRAVVAKRVC